MLAVCCSLKIETPLKLVGEQEHDSRRVSGPILAIDQMLRVKRGKRLRIETERIRRRGDGRHLQRAEQGGESGCDAGGRERRLDTLDTRVGVHLQR